MNSPVFIIISAFVVLCEYALTHPVKYDQRQEGDLNVRTDVEDVLFVVVPPQDLVTAGMGLVAATAADFFRKNYGGIGPERWPMRTSPKLGFVPLEKSPYKIDLEKSGVKVKKVAHVGDPNRYGFQEVKNPQKPTVEVKTPMPTEVPEKPEMITEMAAEMPSTTENKTVKKVLKPEDNKKPAVAEEKKPVEEKKPLDEKKPLEEKKPLDEKKLLEEKKPLDEKKDTKVSSEPMKKTEEVKTKTDTKMSEEAPKVIGEGAKDGFDPTSIFRLEGCGPDAYRDSNGMCVYKKVEISPK